MLGWVYPQYRELIDPGTGDGFRYILFLSPIFWGRLSNLTNTFQMGWNQLEKNQRRSSCKNTRSISCFIVNVGKNVPIILEEWLYRWLWQELYTQGNLGGAFIYYIDFQHDI